jgi:pyruvate kinase
MLESMIENPQATRAEVSDVANAVLSGTDAVMLSGETASGRFPVRAVETMDRVARQAESYLWAEGAFGTITDHDAAIPPTPLNIAVARATANLSRDLRVRGIVVFSTSGMTAGVVAGARPGAPIIGVTTEKDTCRRMSLLWGVVPILVDELAVQHPLVLARTLASDLGLAAAGDFILTVAGFTGGAGSSAPAITVLSI